jgi:4-hydroxybenzoate polyprenyltransferase
MMILKVLKIFRPLNLFIIALSQLLTFYFLAQSSQSFIYIIVLTIGTCSIAAAGYLINDYFDVQRDALNNKTKEALAFLRNNKLFWLIYILLNLVGLLAAWMIQFKLIYIFVVIQLLLFVYSYSWKDLPILGNVTISTIVALAILLVRWVHPDLKLNLLLFYSLFAFFSTWIREMIKDIEDFAGDSEVGSRNLIQLMGIKKSLFLIRILILFVLATLFTSWELIGSFFHAPLSWVVLIYGLVCIVLPMVFQLIISYQNYPNYKLMSTLSKYAMITGILSMLFF